ncbi:hypothetical protein PV341_16205 [Streptomyces sp. PA03-1a]|nr:hypothetical protein [Streptomyces sp. PA03-1a]MDX2813338.1 hypothetical protein [Streptomyces sp. PA03-5A]
MSRSRDLYRANHVTTAATARGERGVWVPVFTYRATPTAQQIARLARSGGLAYGPAGEFEAYAALVPTGAAVWVRYVGGDGPVPPPMPERMTVRVPDYGPGPDYQGVRIVEVSILPTCSVCGGPRGFDRIVPDCFQRDDVWHVRDQWANPCTHKDMYEDVLSEARSLRRRANPVVPVVETNGGRFAEAVEFLVKGATAKRFVHAKQGAQALDEAGHTEAAGIVWEQLQACRGLMSANQAAHHLHTLGRGDGR